MQSAMPKRGSELGQQGRTRARRWAGTRAGRTIKNDGALRARLGAYGAVGVEHVLVEPAKRALEDWLRGGARRARGLGDLKALTGEWSFRGRGQGPRACE